MTVVAAGGDSVDSNIRWHCEVLYCVEANG